MSGNEIREKYLAFMQKRRHAVVPSSALLPENDSTTLFTGSGMQPLVPYLLGQQHPKGTRLANSQKCFRAEDIDEVGDLSHTTFFEMLGNWSLGDYFKAEQISWITSFYLDVLGLDPERLYVTAFIGDEAAGLPKDTEAVEIWQKELTVRGLSNGVGEMGSATAAAKRGMHAGERVFYYDAKENWWSRAGVPAQMPVGEIGGGDSEMFYDFDPSGATHSQEFGEHCHPACDCGRFMEIGNNVFMEYVKTKNGFAPLPKKNIDFGGGLERVAAATLNSPDVYQVDLLKVIITHLEELSGQSYAKNQVPFRVVADHIRGAVFMIADGVLPSNTEQGYVLRRLLRRAVRYADTLGVTAGALSAVARRVISQYEEHYTYLQKARAIVETAIATEEEQFRTTLKKGTREFEKLASTGALSGRDAFVLFTTYGFPYELTEELARERGLTLNRSDFMAEMTRHQEASRAGAARKFKGGLADSSERVVHYHTVTHLLLAALREILGPHVHQAGSNITGERLRFDVTHPEKITAETLAKIEAWVNKALATGGLVQTKTMSKIVAQNDPTVEGSFWDRYPNEVTVYTIIGNDGTVFSRELCGGPHVVKLEDISGTFKITKEESSAAGVRRIKAVLE